MFVRQKSVLLIFCLGLLLDLALPGSLMAQFSFGRGPAAAHHTHVRLLLSATEARPGDTILAGVEMQMDPDWHTYWKNAGDAGSPTTIQWQLPAGVSAGDIQWPVPQKLPPAEVTTYGYEGETVLIVPLTLASNLPAGPLKFSAQVAWLECKDTCIPAHTTVEGTLAVGTATKFSPDSALLQSWQNRTPQAVPMFAFQAWWEPATNADTRPVVILATPTAANILHPDQMDFYPYASDSAEIQAATQSVPDKNGFQFRKWVKKYAGDWPTNLAGLMVATDHGQRTGFEVQIPIRNQPANGTANSVEAAGAPAIASSLGQILFYAFLGGLILNLMPCVLPVIALKILGFVGEAHSEPRRVRRLGWLYALGVLVSFLGLAAVVIGVRAAGHHAGWGMQFSSPIFLVCLTTLVLLVSLNLFGIFEIALGSRALDTASTLASRTGGAGAFFNGVLATTLATPCTAPFLAPALGFAFAQSAPMIVLVFLTIGIGLAAPYVILSLQPAWLKFLPKPGVWMEKFKIAMGFPMLATVVWLFTIATSSYGKDVLWLGAFLVAVAFAVWIFGEFVQRGRRHQAIAALVSVALIVAAYAVLLEKELHWRAPLVAANDSGEARALAEGIDWQPWTPEAVATARATGRPVLVDFTADWCLTCQVNKKTSIEVASVRAKLKAVNAVALVGDYTHSPDAISIELGRYQRAGVPLVLVYPKDPAAPAIVLPALLTPGIVLTALDHAR